MTGRLQIYLSIFFNLCVALVLFHARQTTYTISGMVTCKASTVADEQTSMILNVGSKADEMAHQNKLSLHCTYC